MFDKKKYTLLAEEGKCKIWGCVEKDTTTGLRSGLISVEEADGKIYEPVTVSKENLTVKKNALNFLHGYSMDLNEDDLDSVRKAMMTLFYNSDKVVEVADKKSSLEVLEALADYMEIWKDELVSPDGEIPLTPPVFIKDGRGYIETKKFESFLSENKDLGWGRLEILKMLKLNELLHPGKNRVYDRKVKVNNRCRNFYVIEMPEDVARVKEADEMISIKKVVDENEK